VSIELVPRSLASLDAELRTITERFPALRTVNVPDLLRFPLRSGDACALARQTLPTAIPPLRAPAFAPDRPFVLRDKLAAAGLDSVLVVTGDPPQDLGHRVHATGPVDLIRHIKREAPELTVYAGFDPYRSGVRDELTYLQAKREAGADGFFSQPFFDLRLLDVWAELLAGDRVFWGVSPVLSPRTRSYWETKNRAFFPADFAPTLDWNRDFAARALSWARAAEANLYFMPIRVDLETWLGGIL
jgi:methylenetetrahydrofolate reductase (NADPH)